MIETQLSFYQLITTNNINKLLNGFSNQFDNRIWRIEPFKDNSKLSSIYKIYWIDLIKSDGKDILGKVEDVLIWTNRKNTLLVFCSSYSTVNLVRQFLSDELDIYTNIYNYESKNLLNIINSKENILSIYIKHQDVITAFSSVNLIEPMEKNNIFAVEYIDKTCGKNISVFISSCGLIKLSYGTTLEEIRRIFDDLQTIA